MSARLGTHASRRAFASQLRSANLKELQDLGGWKTSKTVTEAYLQPDVVTQRATLERLHRAFTTRGFGDEKAGGKGARYEDEESR